MEHLDQKKKLTIMIAVMSAMLFAALNQTIVGTALPRIVSVLGGMEYFSWIFTIYMLASSVTAILVGKLSDIYGRKPFILVGIGIFILGSFLSGLSATIIQLIVYRGIQGLGAGMIMSTAFASVGDLYSPRERGRWQGLMGAMFGLASVFGPTLGGYIVNHADWHWIFWIFLPIGLVAFIMIWILFPSVQNKEKEPVDYLGSLFITLTMVPMLLAFSWAGSKYEWSSLEILTLFVSSFVALVLFIAAELKAKSPVLPLFLFKNSIFSVSNLVGFTMGAGMFGAIMYMPFFVQGVIGTSATGSGFVMMPMMLSMVISSAIIGQRITKTGKYKHYAILGLFLMMAGMISMSWMDVKTTNSIAVLNMIVVGLGLGLAFPVFNLTVQNAVDHSYLGVATASTQLFRQLGGTIGVSIFGTVMSHRMADKMQEASTLSNLGELAELNPIAAEKLSALHNPQVLVDVQKLEQIKASLPSEMSDIYAGLLQILREALSYSLSGVFMAGAIVVLMALVLTLFLKEIPLRQSNQVASAKEKQQVVSSSSSG